MGFSLGVLKYVVCLCMGYGECCIFCLYCETGSCMSLCMGSVSVSQFINAGQGCKRHIEEVYSRAGLITAL